MLIARPAGQRAITLDPSHAVTDVARATIWFDLFDPTTEETACVGRITGLRIPTRDRLDEIESSSRLSHADGALYLSTPLVRRQDGASSVVPLGLVVSERHLVTIRYSDYPSIENYGHAVETIADATGSTVLFIGLLEAIVDRLADVLEMVGAELEAVSAGIFRGGSGEQSKRADQRLRALLRGIGRQGDTVSLLRDSMLGLRRLVTFVESAPELHFDAALRTRLGVLGRDLQSLSEFDGQITDKVQFLLDATLGLINIEQNNGIRILTVVSLIGIPPTLIASIYGMNFKNIPELNWSFGYWYALALMVASVALPLAWFRRVGWI
jgi:magnesium transporter